MRKKDVIAVAVSDLHLSLTAPACRADKDWLATQAGYLKQLLDIAGSLPILCAGDLFDRWNPPPELIHFALVNLPDGMICIPGQHDLPNHVLGLKHRSAYGVLAQAGKIVDISDMQGSYNTAEFAVFGFGWEQEIEPLPKNLLKSKTAPIIALIHKYVWVKGCSYPDADPNANVASLKDRLVGYDIAVCGDNHIPFNARAGDCLIFNCGGFMVRKSDELEHRPSVGLLHADGSVTREFLDVSDDHYFTAAEKPLEVPVNMRDFIRQLEGLGEHGLDFREAVTAHLRSDDIHPDTKRIITEALEAKP